METRSDAQEHKRLFLDISQKMSEFRKDMFRNIDYVNGIQYTSDDLKYLTSHRRLPVVWNIILPKILAYTSSERSNRIMARAEAVEEGDVEMAKKINLLLEQDNEDTQANWQVALAACHAAIFRYGVLQTGFERTEKFKEGQYILRALDPRDVWWDCHPSEMDFDNSNFIIYSRWYAPEFIIQKYAVDPDMKQALEEKAAFDAGLKSGKLKEKTFAERLRNWSNSYALGDKSRSVSGGLTANMPGYLNYNDFYRDGMYRVIETHHTQTVKVKYIVDSIRGEFHAIPSGLSSEDERILIQEYLQKAQLGENAVQTFDDTLRMLSVCAPELEAEKLLVDKPYATQAGGYYLKILPGYNLDPDRLGMRSIVDVLIDPQDMMNRDLSSRAHMMNKLLNPDVYLGPSAIDDDLMLTEIKSQKSGKVIQVNNIQDIRWVYPDLGGVNLFTGIAEQSLRLSEYTPGISRNSMGVKESSDESGKLVQTRAGLSEGMMSILFDNVANTIISVEKKHLAIIQQHMTLPRMIRTIGPSGDVEYIGKINVYDPILNKFKYDVSVGKFDIRVDKTKYTRTDRQLELDKLIQVMQMADPEGRLELAPAIYNLLNTVSGKTLKAQAEKRLEVMHLQRELTKLQLEAQIMQITSQMKLQPAMEENQSTNLDVQQSQLELQKQQLEMQKQQIDNAFQAQQAAARNTEAQNPQDVVQQMPTDQPQNPI